jgi:hypothetical protein
MPYFHVVAELDDALGKPVAIFMDLDQRELRTQFLKPYERGIDLVSQNSLYPVRRLRKIHVIQTEALSEHELKEVQRKSREEIDRLNRDSSVVFVSAGHGYDPEDIVYAGTDVTQVFIDGPPGTKAGNSLVASVMNNGWVVAIGGGVVVALLVWFFKLS